MGGVMFSCTLSRIAVIVVAGTLLATSDLNARRGLEVSAQATTTGSPIPGLPGYGVELGLDESSGNIVELMVYRGQTLFQTLKVCTPDPVPRQNPVGTMDTADYNFDGYYDLALETAFKQGNASYCIWLYNPKSGRFVASPQLSQLTNPRPDSQHKTVVSFSRMECGPCYRQETYRWSKGQLVPVREESVMPAELGLQFGGGCGWLRTVREEKNGKMQFVSRTQVNELGQPCLPGQP